jgi:hypothetical protein
MGLELKKGIELFKKKFEVNYHSSSSCVLCVAPPKTFVTL